MIAGILQSSSELKWENLIPGTGESGGLPSIESHRVGHDWSDLAAAAAATHGLPSIESHRVGHDWSDLAAAAAATHS